MESAPQHGLAVPDGMPEDVEVTFFIPCLNEEKRVTSAIETLRLAMEQIKRSYEIIVVNDGSTDRTAAVVEEYQRAHPAMDVQLINNPRNLGLARSFVDAAFRGRGRYYRLICGDNTESVESVVAILSRLGQADIIVPYYLEVAGKSRRHMAISRFYTRLVNFLTGYRLHYYNGNPLYLRYHVMRWAPHNFGFGYQADLLAQLLDLKATYLEIAVTALHRDKGAGASSLNFRNFSSVTHSLLEITLRRLRRVLFKR